MNNTYTGIGILVGLLAVVSYIVKGTAVLVRVQVILESVVERMENLSSRQDAMEKRELDDAIRRAKR